MAGLDTRGLASGFAQGFGLMNQYQHQQQQSARADERLGMERERFDWQRQQAESQQSEAERAREMEQIQFTLGKVAQGLEVDESEFDIIRRHPEVWAGLDPQADPAVMRAVEVFDPSTPADANDPDSLEAANLLFADLINTGEGGQKRIAGWYPAPDGESLMLELEVTREDGSTYRAPMTEGRGTEEDALVKAVKVEDLANHINGVRMLRNVFNASPEGQQRATQMLQLLRGGEAPEQWETIDGPGGSLLRRNVQTGRVESVVGRAPVSRTGAGGAREYAPSTDVRTIEYFKQQGYDHDDAVRLTMELKGRGGDGNYGRNQDHLSYLENRISELDRLRNSRDFRRLDEGRQQEVEGELEQLRTERERVANEMFLGGARPNAGNPGPEQPAPTGGMTADDIINSVLR